MLPAREHDGVQSVVTARRCHYSFDLVGSGLFDLVGSGLFDLVGSGLFGSGSNTVYRMEQERLIFQSLTPEKTPGIYSLSP